MYMFSLCTIVVGLGFFKEVHISFLLVGHMHKDIDQRFNIISNTLKKTDIDSMKEMLALLEKETSPREAFMRA